jgi:hypothetical protein
MIRKALLWLLICGSVAVKAQDFNCKVQVSDPSNDAAFKQVFGALQTSVMEFFNNRKWTTDNIQPAERIDLNISVNIEQKLAIDQFQATFSIQVVRPVYGTNYNTPVLNHSDREFYFRYAELQSMDFNENQYNNLTSFLGFYAYMALGMQYDSFGPDGGNSYYMKAQTIVNVAQTASEAGWKQVMGVNSRNRYAMISDFTNSRFKPIHESIYKYNHLGLDQMSKDAVAGRNVISEVITTLYTLAKANPNTFAIRIFFDAKVDELVEIYKKADNNEKTKIVDMLKQVDITHGLKYDKIFEK